MHGGQIVEYALQFILLDAIADHDELLEEQQNVGAYGQYILLSRSRTICKTGANQTPFKSDKLTSSTLNRNLPRPFGMMPLLARGLTTQ